MAGTAKLTFEKILLHFLIHILLFGVSYHVIMLLMLILFAAIQQQFERASTAETEEVSGITASSITSTTATEELTDTTTNKYIKGRSIKARQPPKQPINFLTSNHRQLQALAMESQDE